MVKTKSVYDAVEQSDGERILVTRYWPRGLSKERLRLTEWAREVAPSSKLIKDWKKGAISWKHYEARYLEEMVLQEENTVDAAKEKHVPVVEKTAQGLK